MSKPKTNPWRTEAWNTLASTGIVVMFLSLLIPSRFFFAVGVFMGTAGSLALIFDL